MDELTSSTQQAYSPSSYVSVRDDSSKIAELVAPADYKYTDVAVADYDLYLLRTKTANVTDADKVAGLTGVVEKRSLYPNGRGGWEVGPVQWARARNYKAIDYVSAQNNSWGLIGLRLASNGAKEVVRNIEANPVVMGSFADVANAETDEIAGLDASTSVNGQSTRRIKLFLRRNFGGVHMEYSVGVHTQSAPASAIAWESTTHGEQNYVSALTEKGGSLFSVRIYQAGKFIKTDPNTWAYQLEQIQDPGSNLVYDSHGYVFENQTTQLTPEAMDYQEAQGRFLALDTVSTSTGSHQVLVALPANRVNL